MLRAYFDASERGGGVLAVAGVSFGPDQAKKAAKRWREVFGDRVLHMTDLHARRGEFAGITAEEAGRLCQAAVGIISRHAHAVVAVSCNVNEAGKLKPAPGPASELLGDAVHSAYNMCTHLAMHSMGSLTRRREGEIQYWFECGDRYQGMTARFLSALSVPEAAPMRRALSYSTYVLQNKTGALLLQAADLVAWEWAKHVERHAAGLKVRPSLAALMGGPCEHDGRPEHRSRNRLGLHCTGMPLQRFYGRMAALMQATTAADIDAAVADVWRSTDAPNE